MKLTASALFAGMMAAALLATTPAHAAGKTYQVATDAAYAPFESLNEKQEVVGFDIEVLSAVAAKAGFKVKFVNTPWEGIFATLSTGDRDIISSAVTITPERKMTMDFSEPYFEAKQLIAVGPNSKITKFTDLKTKKIGVQTGTTGDEVTQKLVGKTNPNIRRYESTPLAMKELLNGGVDAVVADNGVVVNFIANNKTEKLKVIDDTTFAKEYYGFAVKKGNKALVQEINKGLAAIKADGTYDKIYKKYFGK
ncbi:basic amino acid ABC transporter substrate-binding protein [Jeongeupia sp. HS-3]|uniref:basic amino acid ABC transporter substrate-binding protein n=1 Tax=Jeongeupia sp. HS-3 TaxID=1009682 RepID=UPI0018A4A016|nr:basic amino acid ABC transporter substrate-binding protein [Jeongeupia sp. HS-3]BCL74584.1 basic amino acid ABC transporter substrate-binding protein [Jeongeupia sp. HS-3]